MKFKIIISILVFCLLCGCTAVSTVSENITSSNLLSSNEYSSLESVISSGQSSTVSKSEEDVNISFNVPNIVASKKYDDLLGKITDFGKTVIGYGDLSNEEYKTTLLELEDVLDNYNKSISVVAYSLNNTKALAYNTEKALFCACTVKAPFSLFSCLEMDKGNGSLDTKMKYEKKHYEPGTGDMQFSPVGTIFDMKTIIHKSMSISDNVGYFMQVDYFDRVKYNTWISNLGAPSMQIKPTVWSLKAKSKELALSWREIYNYFISGAEHAQFLYSTCTNTADNFATAGLEGVDYSHKPGFNGGSEWPSYCDAGIVWNGQGSYIIVILTNTSGKTSAGAKVMKDIIQIVHNKLM